MLSLTVANLQLSSSTHQGNFLFCRWMQIDKQIPQQGYKVTRSEINQRLSKQLKNALK